MRLILLGPPGAGKGTQAQLLCEAFDVVQISTGDMLRQAVQKDDDFGREVQQVMDSGALVSDDIINRLVKARVQNDDCRNGFIFDGFPRTVDQAKAMLDSGVKIDHVIEISLPDHIIIQRMSGRRVHPGSGRVYHITHNPPQTEGIDDITGQELVQRPDDVAETVRERLRVYHQQTSPLINFFGQLQTIGNIQPPGYTTFDGSKAVQDVHQNIVAVLTNTTH